MCFLSIEGFTPAEFFMKLLVTIKSQMESVSLCSVTETSFIIFIKSWSWINDWINEWNLHSYSNFHLQKTEGKLGSEKKSFQIKNSTFAKHWEVTDIYYSRRGKIRTQWKQSDSENIWWKSGVYYFSFWNGKQPLSCEVLICTAS